MSILDLHAGTIEAATPRYIQPPKLTPEPKFSAWSLLSSVPRGVGEAVAQVGASVAEVVAGYGDVMGRIEEGKPLTDRQPDMSSDFGELLRERGREFRPDPTDSHAAEQVLYGFARGASKVVGGSLLAGPIGVVGAGLEESISAADDLARQGVDFRTRVQAGGVQGAGLAIAALPLLGKTLPQTAGLYLAGGPGGFVAQQALTREILQAGGYDAVADQYDPLDPVGLAVSTLVPAVFTAAGIRAQRRASAVSRDVADAARVALQAEQRRTSNPAPDVPRSADAHETALARAEDAIARGDAVQVADVAPMGRPSVNETPAVAEQRATVGMIDAQIAQTEAELAATLPAASGLAEPGQIREARAELRLMEQTRVDQSEAAARTRAKEIQAAKRVSYKAALSQAKKEIGDAAADWQARADRLNALIARNAEAQRQTQRAGELEQQLRTLRQRRQAEAARLDEMTTSPMEAFGAGVRELVRAMEESGGAGRAQEQEGAKGARAGSSEAQPTTGTPPATPARGDGATPADPAAAPAGGAVETPGVAAEQGAATARLDQVRAQFPDLMVRMDDMDAPMRLDDFLAAVRAEADELEADAPLMQVAAECALLNGA